MTKCEMLLYTDTGMKCVTCKGNAICKCKQHSKDTKGNDKWYCDYCYIKHSKWHKSKGKK